MIENVLTALITFATPLPWWLILLHLASQKGTLCRLLAYGSIGVAWIAFGYVAFTISSTFFTHRLPRSLYLQILGSGLSLVALILDWQVMKSLGFKRLTCIGEIRRNSSPGELVTAGIYRYSRHPRYVEYPLWSLGFSLIFGYLFLLWLSVYLFVAFWLATYFEESELVRRFGQAYIDYQKKVPRFFIRLNK